MSGKMSHEEFLKKAIVSLRKEGYKGIHTIYSGFNEAFKKYFNSSFFFLSPFPLTVFLCASVSLWLNILF